MWCCFQGSDKDKPQQTGASQKRDDDNKTEAVKKSTRNSSQHTVSIADIVASMTQSQAQPPRPDDVPPPRCLFLGVSSFHID